MANVLIVWFSCRVFQKNFSRTLDRKFWLNLKTIRIDNHYQCLWVFSRRGEISLLLVTKKILQKFRIWQLIFLSGWTSPYMPRVRRCSSRNWGCLALKPRTSPKQSKTVVSVVTQNKTIWYRVKKYILKPYLKRVCTKPAMIMWEWIYEYTTHQG